MRFASEHVDLVVLDIMLPKLDGLEVCKRLRAESEVPIIMLTARDDELDKVVGLKPKLLAYNLHAVTGGKDAQGEVSVRLEEDGLTISGRGASTDVVEASAKAYLNAVNKLVQDKKQRSRARNGKE